MVKVVFWKEIDKEALENISGSIVRGGSLARDAYFAHVAWSDICATTEAEELDALRRDLAGSSDWNATLKKYTLDA